MFLYDHFCVLLGKYKKTSSTSSFTCLPVAYFNEILDYIEEDFALSPLKIEEQIFHQGGKIEICCKSQTKYVKQLERVGLHLKCKYWVFKILTF